MIHRNTEEMSNGIEFTRRTRITLANKILISPKLKILQFILVIAGVYGTLLSFISGLNIPVYKSVLYAFILIFVTCHFVFYQFPSYIKYSLPISFFIYLGAGYVFLDELKNGFWHLENIYIAEYNDYFKTSILKFLVDDYDKTSVITIFLIFASALLSLILSYIILKNALRFLFAVITVPIIALPFTVGQVPQSLPLGIYLICAISLMGMGTTKERYSHLRTKKYIRKEDDERSLEQNFRYVIGLKVGGQLGGLLLILLLVLSLIITPDLFQRKLKVDDTRRKIQRGMMEFDLEKAIQNVTSIKVDGIGLFKSNTATGGLSGGKLGRIGEVNFNYKPALRIETVDTGSNIYLKGYVGSVYKKDHWEGLSNEDINNYKKAVAFWEYGDFSNANMTSYFLSLLTNMSFTNSYNSIDFINSNIIVEELDVNSEYVYTPYYTVYKGESIKNLDDIEYVLPKDHLDSYQFNYYNCLSNILEFNEEHEYQIYLSKFTYYDKESQSRAYDVNTLDKFRAYEQAYRAFVYDVYTRLPEDGLEQIRKEFGIFRYEDFKNNYDGLMILVDLVKRKLSLSTTYSLSPGTLPKNKDFVEYFLYENKTGYCAHFASAATMIFRTMGIPARYVEGYVVKTADIARGDDVGTLVVPERIDGVLGKYHMLIKSVEITDANAHAWVEIYVDGFGWVPVEVTPGYNGYVSGEETKDVWANRADRLKQTLPSTIPTPNPVKNEKEEKEEKDQLSDSEKDKKQTTEDSRSRNQTQRRDKKSSSNFYIIKIGYVLLWGVALIAGTILFLLLRAYIILSKREKNQKTTDLSKRVLHRYKEIQRILNYYNIKEEEDLTCIEAASKVEEQWNILQPGSYMRFVEIALKARFHQHSITKEEEKEAEEFYIRLITSLYTDKPLIQRLVLRFILVFR